MRFHLLFVTGLCLFLGGKTLAQNNFQLIGAADKNDRANRLIRTANGDFVMAGRVDNDAALYRFDCSGQILDSLRWDLAAPSSFEEFFDVMELPNGEFLAVGTANILAQYNSGLAMRVDANLKVLLADTMDVFGKDAALLQLARSKDGTVYLGGAVAGQSINFSDGFCAAFSPNSLTIKDSITVFNYGLDYPRSLSITDDGDLLMSGMAPVGNIFDSEALISNRAFVRKFKTDGTLRWQHLVEAGTFKNKFGRAYYSSAVQNPVSGNIIATGNIFTGDTTKGNILDLHYTLLSSSGLLLDDTVAALPGSQHLYQSLRYDGTGNPFFAVGDSAGNVFSPAATAPLSTVFLDFGNQLFVFNTTVNRDVSASIRNIVNVPDQRLAYVGSFYEDGDEDIFVLFPSVEIQVVVNGPSATVTQPISPGYTYQWYNASGAIPGATGTTYTSPVNGQHAVLVTDPQGCTGLVIVTLLAPLNALLEITQEIHCHGDKTGEIDVTPLGGTPPHRYGLNGGPLQSSNTFSALAAGEYVVKIVDSENTMFSAPPITLTEPPQLAALASLVQNTLTVNASGGTPPMQYSLNNGPFQVSSTFPNLPPGEYSVKVKDAYGCTTLSNSVKVTSAIVEPKTTWGLAVSPNPSQGVFHISAAKAPAGSLRAALYDLSGRPLRHLVWETLNSRLDTTLDLRDWPPGIYALWMTDGQHWGATWLEVVR